MKMKIRDKSNDQDVYIPPSEPEDYVYEPTEPEVDRTLIDLHELLAEVDPEGAPLVSVLEAWKEKHVSLYVSKISSDSPEYFVFTTIKRSVFKRLQSSGVFDNEEKGNEVLVEHCLLYPAPTQKWRLESDAGIITTLGKQIAHKSGFVSPQEALALIKII